MFEKFYIAEKPKLGKKVAKILGGQQQKFRTHIEGENWCVSWGFGHLLQLSEPEDHDEKYRRWNLNDLPLQVKSWHWKPVPDKLDQLNAIKRLAEKSLKIVNLGDADAEGQCIVDNIIAYCGFKGEVLRLWAKSQDDAHLKKALVNLQPNGKFRSLFLSAECRHKLDQYVGFSLTRTFTKIAQAQGYTNVVPLGRVQTAVHHLIAEHYRKIKNFKPESYFEIEAQFAVNNVSYKGAWVPSDSQTTSINGKALCGNKEIADAVVKAVRGNKCSITQNKVDKKSESAPLPFNQADIQAHCSKKFKLRVDDILEICQSLYETHDLISYPRAAERHLTTTEFHEAAPIIKNLSALDDFAPFKDVVDLEKMPRCYSAKAANSSHQGIIPTLKKPDLSVLSANEKRVYLEIAKRFYAQFLPKCQTQEQSLITVSEGQKFRTKINCVVSKGWKALLGGGDKKENLIEGHIPSGASGVCQTALLSSRKTKPPQDWEESDVLAAMNNIHKYLSPDFQKLLDPDKGLGTVATQADAIRKVRAAGYVKITSKDKIVITALGNTMDEVFPESIKSPDITAFWDHSLRQVEEGKSNGVELIEKQLKWVDDVVIQTKANPPKLKLQLTSNHQCNKEGCSGVLVRKMRKDKTGHFWVCSSDECNNMLSDLNHKPVFPLEGDGEKCPICNEGIMKTFVPKAQKGKHPTPFLGCTNFRNHKSKA